MDRGELLRTAIAYLIKAKEAGGYIGYEADVNTVIKEIQWIRVRVETTERQR